MRWTDRTWVINPYDKDDAVTYYPVAIIGAGESGIAAACRLKLNLKNNNFKVFDRQSGVGGTWWINRYPGVACDVPAAFYSFSFAPNYGSKQIFSSGAEFVQYLYDVVAQVGILDKIQLNTEVIELRWNQSENLWDICLAHLEHEADDFQTSHDQKHGARQRTGPRIIRKERIKAKIVMSCVGILVEPKLFPKGLPGTNEFKGRIVHSSRWPSDLVLDDKHVVIVGSGCSAAQIVPAILKEPWRPKSVTQIMRTPPYVEPRVEEPGGRETYARTAPYLLQRIPGFGFVVRLLLFLSVEIIWMTAFQRKYAMMRKLFEARDLKHVKDHAPKKYHSALTPKYPYGCKRRVFDDDWLTSTNDARFKLTTDRLTGLQLDAVLLSKQDNTEDNTEDMLAPQSKSSPADVIILANGFEATHWLHPLQVYGRTGKRLQEVWDERGGPQAYMGVAMDDFPNLFFVLGPNTACGHSSFILASENCVKYICAIIDPILRGRAVFAEVKEDAQIRWTRDVQTRLKDTMFESKNLKNFYLTFL